MVGQQDQLDSIEAHIESTVASTAAAPQEIKRTIKLQQAARKKSCIILGCVVLILVIVAIVLGVKLGQK